MVLEMSATEKKQGGKAVLEAVAVQRVTAERRRSVIASP
jgi:hypothetical protein